MYFYRDEKRERSKKIRQNKPMDCAKSGFFSGPGFFPCNKTPFPKQERREKGVSLFFVVAAKKSLLELIASRLSPPLFFLR